MIFTRYIHVHFVIKKIDSIYVNGIKEMVSFELSKEMEKDVFVLSWTGDREKILSSHEELNLRPVDSTLWCPTTEP